VTADPIGIKKGENHLFTYVKNNPIKQVDPLGLLCGSGLTDLIVPDAPGGFDFSKACEWHDRCYGSCRGESSWSDKSECDYGFYLRIRGICESDYGYSSKCYEWAKKYHWGVSNNNLAVNAYANAQIDVKCNGACKFKQKFNEKYGFPGITIYF
jgi:hypothetical protein